MRKLVIYGSFDMYGEPHRKIIKKWAKKGYKIYAGIETDEFLLKSKRKSILSYDLRHILLESDPIIFHAFPMENESQIIDDYNKIQPEKVIFDKEKQRKFSDNSLLAAFDIRYEDIETTNEVRDMLSKKKVVITYGTFDLLHKGHNNIIENASSEGDILIVAVSTEEFNTRKGKKAYESFSTRISCVRNMNKVNFAIPENSWSQKKEDFKKLNVNTLVMGGDWIGKFDKINKNVTVKIYDRTPGISSTMLREKLNEK